MKSKLKAIITAFFIFLISTCGIAQNFDKDTLTRKQLQNLPLRPGFKQYPIVRDTFNKYPKNLKIEGTIIGFTQGTSCGVVCGCGTLKVLLTKKIKRYSHKEIFLAIPCFNSASNQLIGKKILANIDILSIENDECFFKGASINRFDSKGIPFYIPSNSDKRFIIE